MNQFGNRVNGILRSYSTFVEHCHTIFNFALALRKKNNEKYVSTWIVDIVKDVLSSNLLKSMSTQYNHWYIEN